MTDLIAIQTPQGITWVTRENYVATLGTPNNLGAINAGQGVVAAASVGAGLAQSLLAAGVASQALPVIGQILGGIALVGGYILSARAKAKAAKEQGAQIDTATVQLLQQSSELDGMLLQAQKSLTEVRSEIIRLGLSGTALGGFSDWLAKTFTPGKYQARITADKQANYETLLNQVEQKITKLQSIETELNGLYDKLTSGKTLQKALLIGGGLALGLTAFYFLNEKYKWIKL